MCVLNIFEKKGRAQILSRVLMFFFRCGRIKILHTSHEIVMQIVVETAG